MNGQTKNAAGKIQKSALNPEVSLGCVMTTVVEAT